MAELKIIVTDHPTDGTVDFTYEPAGWPMALVVRVRAHGADSLTPAETFALAALAHMTEHAEDRKRPSIILPGTDGWSGRKQ